MKISRLASSPSQAPWTLTVEPLRVWLPRVPREISRPESRTTVEPAIPEGWRGERGADGKNAHTRVIQTQGNRRVCKKRQVAARGQGHIVQLPQEGPTGCSQGKKVEWQRK